MKKDQIFFANEGLTSTSANYIANLAKEMYQSLETKLEDITLYTTEIGILGCKDTNILKEGVSIDFLKEIDSNLIKIAKLKSLIAWLREAIKAKERLIREAQIIEDTAIADILGIVIPESPKAYVRLSEDDIVATWNIKQRNIYYYLDTVCSTIGSYIHPKGDFSLAREKFIKILSEKHIASGSGRDTVIYTRTPTVGLQDVEDTFFQLQNKYREYQAELNSMKHQIEVALQEDDVEKSQKESLEMQEYANAIKSIQCKISEYRKDTVRAMQTLKIVIPDSLKSVYELVSSTGK